MAKICLLGLSGYFLGSLGLMVLSFLAGREFNVIVLAILTVSPYFLLQLAQRLPVEDRQL